MTRVNVEALEAHVDAQLADLRVALLERPDRLGRGEAMAFVRAAYGRAYLHGLEHRKTVSVVATAGYARQERALWGQAILAADRAKAGVA